ncbi:hypothetical protein [Paenibacillus silvisoli]|uniref:hypothetical protein n=1 Tax=Paenibacillus silvisoli TaxID=3110539 RepID=UPI0028048EA4|nr:hypothetical protein [Paenibacillus silvisoli]
MELVIVILILAFIASLLAILYDRIRWKIFGADATSKTAIVASVVLFVMIIAASNRLANENPTVAESDPTPAAVETESTEASTTKVEETKAEEKKVTEVTTAVEEVKEDPFPLITESGGIGDHRTAMEKQYGEDLNEEGSALSAYQNNEIVALYIGDIVGNVSLQFEATDTPRRTLDEALAAASKVIPKDAKKVKAYDITDDEMVMKHVVEYQSNELATRLKGMYDGDESLGIAPKTPGSFLVMAKGFKEDGTYFSVVVGWGTKP